MSNNQKSLTRRQIYQEGLTAKGQRYTRIYKLGRKLGEGGFGQVYEIMKDNKKMALKMIKKYRQDQKNKDVVINDVQKIKCQIRMMKKFNHPSIIKILHEFQDKQYIYILMELCVGGTLNEVAKRRHHLTQPEVRFIVVQMVEILKVLKQHHVVHRDIKLANIFLTRDYKLILGDFGLSIDYKQIENKRTPICGTPNYIAPQIIKKVPYDYSIDMWSTGVLIFILLLGLAPFQTSKAKLTYQKILKRQLIFKGKTSDIDISSDAKNFLDNILQLKPTDRLNLENIFDHPFMKNYKIPQILDRNFPYQIPSGVYLRKYNKNIKQQICSEQNYRKNLVKQQKNQCTQQAKKKQKIYNATYRNALHPGKINDQVNIQIKNTPKMKQLCKKQSQNKIKEIKKQINNKAITQCIKFEFLQQKVKQQYIQKKQLQQGKIQQNIIKTENQITISLKSKQKKKQNEPIIEQKQLEPLKSQKTLIKKDVIKQINQVQLISIQQQQQQKPFFKRFKHNQDLLDLQSTQQQHYNQQNDCLSRQQYKKWNVISFLSSFNLITKTKKKINKPKLYQQRQKYHQIYNNSNKISNWSIVPGIVFSGIYYQLLNNQEGIFFTDDSQIITKNYKSFDYYNFKTYFQESSKPQITQDIKNKSKLLKFIREVNQHNSKQSNQNLQNKNINNSHIIDVVTNLQATIFVFSTGILQSFFNDGISLFISTFHQFYAYSSKQNFIVTEIPSFASKKTLSQHQKKLLKSLLLYSKKSQKNIQKNQYLESQNPIKQLIRPQKTILLRQFSKQKKS